MLVNLHVKNFAIIDEIDVDFGRHLNILTGETGAGKSILVGSIGIALGARVSPEMIGKNGDFAMVEIVFQLENEETIRKIREMDLELEDGQIVISRKITGNRSINKINGESVSVSVIRRVAALCIDIHGQHEHQSLLDEEKHRDIVDEYAGEKCSKLKERISSQYHSFRKLKMEIEQDTMSAEERARQLGFLEYEKNEIETARLKQGEEAELEERYRVMSSAGTIVETLGDVYQECSEHAAGAISRGLRRLHTIAGLDSRLSGFLEELLQIEGLLSDLNREMSEFMTDFSFDENELLESERRLDLIHSIQAKYGESYEDIMNHLSQVNEKLNQFGDYEAYCSNRQQEYEQAEEVLKKTSSELTALRKKTAAILEKQISDALRDLNFSHVDFEIRISERDNYTASGVDDVEFMIATNPGEPRRSLGKVASGGELSRVMLAIKSVFADNDEIETLIFDEIDVGISGRTAQKVSEKMNLLGNHHQIICITHLAQIAAMADSHFVIEKMIEKDKSITQIRSLNRNEMEDELARILGGVLITDSVKESAHEMKELADSLKQYLHK